jgi:cell division initiation protein
MKLTPLDVRQKRFEVALRGFSRREVEGFLELVAGVLEEVVRENISLKEELKRLQARVDHHAERERTLQETMVTAQRIAEDLKGQAKKEAEIVIADAEHQAEKIVDGANQKLVQIISDINELKRQRVQFEAQVRSVVDAHAKLLEAFRAPTTAERIEDNVAFFARKKPGGTEG